MLRPNWEQGSWCPKRFRDKVPAGTGWYWVSQVGGPPQITNKTEHSIWSVCFLSKQNTNRTLANRTTPLNQPTYCSSHLHLITAKWNGNATETFLGLFWSLLSIINCTIYSLQCVSALMLNGTRSAMEFSQLFMIKVFRLILSKSTVFMATFSQITAISSMNGKS